MGLRRCSGTGFNHEPTARLLKDRVVEHFGAGMLVDKPREGMGAEDFAYFVEAELNVKGVYFLVGGTPAEKVDSAPSHHAPFFEIEPEPSIKSGVEAMVVGAMTLMAKRVVRGTNQ